MKAELVDKIDQGRKKVYEVETSDYRTLIATSNHPLLTPKGWKRIEDLREEEIVVTVRKMPENFAEWLGIFAGDGWLTRSKRNWQICMSSGEEGRWNYLYSKRLGMANQLLGFHQRHNNMRLPKWIYHLPREKIKAFILGFFDADGWEDPRCGARRFEVASKWIARDFKLLSDWAGFKTGKGSIQRKEEQAPSQ